MVTQQADLVLLVVPVALVDTRGSRDSIAFGHGLLYRGIRNRVEAAINLLSNEAARTEENLGL